VAPVGVTNAEDWNESFRKLWESVLSQEQRPDMFRLGWCPAPNAEQNEEKWDMRKDFGSFQLLNRGRTYEKVYRCTTAFLVHRVVLPSMLNVFPCCSDLETCLSHDLFNWPYLCDRRTCWLQLRSNHVDFAGSEFLTKNWSSMEQRGIFAHFIRSFK